MTELSGRPLLASAADAQLFVDRARELDVLERSARARLNALVVGDRGAGKTSLLHQLERRLEGEVEVVPLFVEGARRAERPEEVLSLLAYQLDAERARALFLEEIMPALSGRPPRTSIETILAGLRTVREVLVGAGRRYVLIVDELASGDVAGALFGQLRDELWSLPATWVVAAERGEQASYLRPPANAFFETLVELEPLADQEAVELLSRRTPDLDAAAPGLQEIAAAAEGNPRRLIALAREALLEGRSLEEAAEARAARGRKAAALGEAAGRAVAYLETHGAASASDERMLSELGWTRSRATQVLRRLEEAGVVRATSERIQGGRRKVYALSEPREPR